MNVLMNRISAACPPSPRENVSVDRIDFSFRRNRITVLRLSRYFAEKGKVPPAIEVDIRFVFYKRGEGGVGDVYVNAPVVVATEGEVLAEDVYNKIFTSIDVALPAEVYTYLWGTEYVLDSFHIVGAREK